MTAKKRQVEDETPDETPESDPVSDEGVDEVSQEVEDENEPETAETVLVRCVLTSPYGRRGQTVKVERTARVERLLALGVLREIEA